MTNPDTSREAVERNICNPIINHVHDGRMLSEQTLAGIIDTSRALLAERDEAIEFYGLCHEHRVKVEDERDALKAKLSVAVDALNNAFRSLVFPVSKKLNPRGWDLQPRESIWYGVKTIQCTLDTLNADTTPDPRVEGWNAAIKAAAKLLRIYAVEKGNTKTGNGRTAIFYARKVETLPCPYQPKEGKDDDQ